MDTNTDNTPPKNGFINFIEKNKKKLLILISILILMIFLFISFQVNENKKNILFSEKYMNAQILLSKNRKIEAKNLFIELIKSKNKFYSISALNMIVENNLENDEIKILNYFELVKKTAKERDQIDLINFKKALYLIQISKIDDGKKILKNLSEKGSNLRIMADEILAE